MSDIGVYNTLDLQQNHFTKEPMKKSDLFDVAIKLFGVNILIQSILHIKDFVLMMSAQRTVMNSSYDWDEQINAMRIAYISNIAVELLLGLTLLFASGFIARKLIRSDSEPGVNFTLDKQAGVEIACVVLGGLMITTALGTLGNQFISFIQFRQAEYTAPSYGIPNMLWQVFLIFLGYCIVAGHAWIGRHFSRKP